MVYVATRDGDARARSCRCSSAGPRPAASTPRSRSRPRYDGPVVHVADASRVIDVVSQLLSPTQRPGFADANRREQAELREKYAARQDRPTLPYAQALANRLRIDLAHAAAGAVVPGPAAGRGAARRAGALHRLDVLLHGLGAEGPLPRHPRPPPAGRRGPRAVRRCADAARPDRRPRAVDGARRLRLLAGGERRRRHRRLHAGTRDRDREQDGADALPDAAPAGGHRRRQAESIAGRLHRPARQRRRRLPRRLRGHRRDRRRRAGPRVRGAARRLPRDHGQGPRRSAGRGVRRVPARPGAARLGLRRGRSAVAGRPAARGATAAFGRPSAIRPVRITARSAGCSTCSAPSRSAWR